MERVTYRGALFRRRTEMVTGVGPFKGLVGSIALSRTSLQNRIPRELFHYLVFPQSPAAKRSDVGSVFYRKPLHPHPTPPITQTRYADSLFYSVSGNGRTNFSKYVTFDDNPVDLKNLARHKLALLSKAMSYLL